jgi:hypothetical protein
MDDYQCTDDCGDDIDYLKMIDDCTDCIDDETIDCCEAFFCDDGGDGGGDDGCQNLSQEECEESSNGCGWSGSYCTEHCDDCECAMYSDQGGCESHDGDGHYCYWEDNLCHDENSGPPECIFDCPDFELINNDGGVNSADEFCTVIAGWETDTCLDDCSADNLEEVSMLIGMCAACLAADNCEDLFGGDDCDSCHDDCYYFDDTSECHNNCDMNDCGGCSDDGWEDNDCDDYYNPELDGSVDWCLGGDDGGGDEPDCMSDCAIADIDLVDDCLSNGDFNCACDHVLLMDDYQCTDDCGDDIDYLKMIDDCTDCIDDETIDCCEAFFCDDGGDGGGDDGCDCGDGDECEESSNGCGWSGSYCTEHCDDCECAMYSDQGGCESHDGDGHYCYWEDNLCHDENSGPPECIFDCPDFELINNDGGVNSADEFCTVIAGWETDTCLDDCSADNLEEVSMLIGMCAACLAADNCEDLFGGDDCDSCHDDCYYFDDTSECHNNCDMNDCGGCSDDGWEDNDCDDYYNPELDGSVDWCLGGDDGGGDEPDCMSDCAIADIDLVDDCLSNGDFNCACNLFLGMDDHACTDDCDGDADYLGYVSDCTACLADGNIDCCEVFFCEGDDGGGDGDICTHDAACNVGQSGDCYYYEDCDNSNLHFGQHYRLHHEYRCHHHHHHHHLHKRILHNNLYCHQQDTLYNRKHNRDNQHHHHNHLYMHDHPYQEIDCMHN